MQVQYITTLPLSLVVVSEEDIAITFGGENVIKCLTVSTTNHITVTNIIRTSVPYNTISLMNDTTFLVNTIEDRRPLRTMTMSGEEKDFDNLSQKAYGFSDNNSAYVHNNDTLVLTDKSNHTVYMYDNKETCIVRTMVKDERIEIPRGVCVGPSGSIFVCSQDTNSLVQVSASGRVLCSHTLDMKYPSTVYISKDGKKLAVSNCALGEVKV